MRDAAAAHGIRSFVGGQWGQICPFDKSLGGPKALRIDSSGPWYRVVNLTRFPIFGSSGDRGGGPGVRDAAAAHGIRSFEAGGSNGVRSVHLTNRWRDQKRCESTGLDRGIAL